MRKRVLNLEGKRQYIGVATPTYFCENIDINQLLRKDMNFMARSQVSLFGGDMGRGNGR